MKHVAEEEGSRLGLASLSMRVLAVFSALYLGSLFVGTVVGFVGWNHFTNWGLLTVCLFVVTWIVMARRDSKAENGVRQDYESRLLALAVVPILGVQGLVIVLITAIPIMDSHIFAVVVGEVSVGVGNLMNIVVHYVPAAVITIVLVARHGKWVSGLEHVLGIFAEDEQLYRAARSRLLFVQCVAFPLCFSGVYSSVFDYNKEYSVNVSQFQIYGISLVFLILYYAFWMSAVRMVGKS